MTAEVRRLTVGLAFGGPALALRLAAALATAPEIAALAVNEIVFPIGCAAWSMWGRLWGGRCDVT
jgi:hypothetical protein